MKEREVIYPKNLKCGGCGVCKTCEGYKNYISWGVVRNTFAELYLGIYQAKVWKDLAEDLNVEDELQRKRGWSDEYKSRRVYRG